MSLDPQQTAVIKAPVGPKAAFDAVKERGVHGYDETSGCPTICPGDGLDYVRSTIHPDDASPASPLSGSETVTVLQAGELVETTVQAIVDLQPSGSYQPLDSDLTAIAALSTQAYGRSLLTAATAPAARAILGTVQLPNSQALGDITPTPSKLATLTIPANTLVYDQGPSVVYVDFSGYNYSAGIAQTFEFRIDSTVLTTLTTSSVQFSGFFARFKLWSLNGGQVLCPVVEKYSDAAPFSMASSAAAFDAASDIEISVWATSASLSTIRAALSAIIA